MPKCVKCSEEKVASEFYSAPSNSSGLSSWCVQCQKDGSKESRLRNKDSEEYKARKNRDVREAQRKAQERSLPGATNRGNLYTDKDLLILSRQDLSTKDKAKMLGRTEGSVRKAISNHINKHKEK